MCTEETQETEFDLNMQMEEIVQETPLGIYLRSIRLKNIQSWKDLTLHFTNGMNVIEARNESGKSVPIKVLRKMCVPIFFGGKGNQVLIRRGETLGEAWFDYGAYIIKFEIYSTYQIYRLLNPQHEELESWKQNVLPERLKSLMRLYYDDEELMILSVIDQELGIPFDSTSPRFNASVLKFFTSHERLETGIENLSNWLEEISEGIVKENMNYNSLTHLKEIYKHTDIDAFKENIECKEKLYPIVDFFDKIRDGLNEIENLDVKQFKYVNKERIEKVLKSLTSLKKLPLQELLALYVSRRNFSKVNKEEIQRILKQLELFKQLPISQLKYVIENKKYFNRANKVEIERIIKVLQNFDNINSNLKTLDKHLGTKRNFNHVNKVKLNRVLNTYESLTTIQSALQGLAIYQSKQFTIQIQLDKLRSKIKEFQEVYKVCPLCGQTFIEGGHTHD